MITTFISYVVVSDDKSVEARAFIPVYEECKGPFLDFYKEYRSRINYRYFDVPKFVDETRLVGILELESKTVSQNVLNNFPSDQAVRCMPNANIKGTVDGSFNSLLSDIKRARGSGSKRIYVDIGKDSYVVRFRR